MTVNIMQQTKLALSEAAVSTTRSASRHDATSNEAIGQQVWHPWYQCLWARIHTCQGR